MLVVPHLILRQGSKILLTRRAISQKVWAGYWHCVTGSVENSESPKAAIIREAKEEIGLEIKELNLVTTIFLVEKDCFNPSEQFYGLELFFLSNLAHDQVPKNMEPSKQDLMDWLDYNNLPETMIPGVAFGIKCYLNNKNYAELYNF